VIPDRVSQHGAIAGSRTQQSKQDFNQGAFARSIWTEQAGDAWRQIDGNVLQRLEAAICLGNRSQFDDTRTAGLVRRSGPDQIEQPAVGEGVLHRQSCRAVTVWE